MSNNLDLIDTRNVFTDCDDKYGCKAHRGELNNYRQVYENDKKMKREIANCNERRRMQSINSGFETLKLLLPMTAEGEKLSKASILQLTAKYIQTLLNRLSNLEKEISCYKKSPQNKDKFQRSKSPPSIVQEQTRKRRLNSCASETITFELDQHRKTTDIDDNTFFSLSGSETCLLTCESNDKTPGSLEHLVAAIEQVEGEKFYVATTSTSVEKTPKLKLLTTTSAAATAAFDEKSVERRSKLLIVSSEHSSLNKTPKSSNHSVVNSAVMKPTISPYTEKIILAVSQHPHMFDSRQELPLHLFSNPSMKSATFYDNVDSLSLLNVSESHNRPPCSPPPPLINRNKTL